MKKISIIIASFVLIAAIFIFHKAEANPIQLIGSITSSAATSTQTEIGTGTSTSIVFDAYALAGARAYEGATLLLQETAASTTGSILTVSFQYSQDGYDYYSDNLSYGTSTQPVSLQTTRTYTWTPGTTATTSRAISFDTPVRFTKVVLSATGATSSVWAQVVPRKQVNE